MPSLIRPPGPRYGHTELDSATCDLDAATPIGQARWAAAVAGLSLGPVIRHHHRCWAHESAGACSSPSASSASSCSFFLPFFLLQGTPRCPPALGIWDGINLTVLLLSFFFDFLMCEQSSMFFFLSFFLPFCALEIWYGINLPVLLLSIFTFVPCEHPFFSFLM